MSNKIIVVVGPGYIEENIAAQTLKQSFSEYKHVSLEEEIKEEFRKYKLLTRQQLERNYPLYRKDIANFADSKRLKNPNYWINKIILNNKNLIITGIRLRHEINVLKMYKATTIKIESNLDDSLNELNNYKDWNCIIRNYNSIDDLKRKIHKIAQNKQFSNFENQITHSISS